MRKMPSAAEVVADCYLVNENVYLPNVGGPATTQTSFSMWIQLRKFDEMRIIRASKLINRNVM